MHQSLEIANCSECEYPHQVIVIEKVLPDGTIKKEFDKDYYCTVCKTELRLEDIY
jgi:hypothetical protein